VNSRRDLCEFDKWNLGWCKVSALQVTHQEENHAVKEICKEELNVVCDHG
jgi:hypothetical protein